MVFGKLLSPMNVVLRFYEQDIPFDEISGIFFLLGMQLKRYEKVRSGRTVEGYNKRQVEQQVDMTIDRQNNRRVEQKSGRTTEG